jgi:hypothetical protein
MEALPPRLTLKAGLWQQAALAALLLAALLCAPGCTLDQYWTAQDGAPRPGHPCRIATAWLNRVQYTPDVVHDGVSTPGLVCRVYLFDETEKYPLAGDGAIVVDLFDDTNGPTTQPLERWHIDPVTLKKFLKRDTVGWGYTLFLPWGSCKPEVTKVHVMCKYEPVAGPPLFDEATPLTLEHVPPPGTPTMNAMPKPPAMLPQLPMPAPLK